MQFKKKVIPKLFLITILLLSATFSQAMLTTEKNHSNNINSLKDNIAIQQPILETSETDNTIVTHPSVDTYLVNPGKPKIPVIKKTYTFPKETTIQKITCTPIHFEEIPLNHPIQQTPTFTPLSTNTIIPNQKNNKTYSMDTYPEQWYTYQTGAGITSSGDHVIYVTITLQPYQYNINQESITYASNFDIKIDHSISEKTILTQSFEENHELVIITPDTFVSTLTPLVNHKNQYDLNPLVKTTNEIYNQFQGRDKPEKIKYFIKHAIETYNTQYVLLIGDITHLPIRTTDAYPWSGFHSSGLLSDLYYADVYDASYSFSSWDTNNNDVFGEVIFGDNGFIPEEFIDEVDLYPDVHIGRIPCSNTEELSIVTSKIIEYETIAAYKNWFNQIILAGGDTFPLSEGSPFNQFEGEITNVKVGQQLPGFKQIRLWASERNLNARTFNDAISNGAGFVSYAGHGFEHGWGTYRPNAVINSNLIWYFTPFLKGLTNEHRLPVVFFDACLTAKLDFNISDLQDYFGLKARLFGLLFGYDLDDKYYPPFAWAILKMEGGGAIATIGATRSAYTFVDREGVYGGAGFLDFRFFNAYEDGITVGEMLSAAQTDYLNYVGKDVFTVEEYLLLGDPSLQVGGYL